MARCLTWVDLSKEQIADLDGLTEKSTIEQYLSAALNLPDYHTDLRQGILIDLYVNTLRFAATYDLTADKKSAFFSIVKVNHFKAVEERLTLEKSFAYFKQIILQHSVQRPPYSIGLFSFQGVKDITDWMIDTYYRHYKLYQYAFTQRFTLDLSEFPPLLETCPALIPLDTALNSRKWQEHLDELARQQAEKEAQEKLAAEEAAEAARQAALVEEYQNAIPDEIHDRVQKVLEEKMAAMKVEMEAQFKQQEETLLERITILENGGERPSSKQSGKK